MIVYKFGGASIASPERMRNLLPVIHESKKPLLLVVSAIGKITNALEAIVASAVSHNMDDALEKLHHLEELHNAYACAILSSAGREKVQHKLDELYTEIHWALDDAALQSREYIYDQVVCIGELLATTIFQAFLEEQQCRSQWLDVRDIIKTNTQFGDPDVDQDKTQGLVQKILIPALQQHDVVITQGFIGSTADNASVTLGREGSDYSAALLAAMCKADTLTIWKDVEGLKNADPKLFPNTVDIEKITYHEVIEMAYYGAQVIHPKTIKPLQNAGIPLYVKCFLDTDLKGTVICNDAAGLSYPPLIILKKDQVLLQITSRDFSFITEDNLSKIYTIFYHHHVKIHLIQNAAISLVVCVDQMASRLQPLIEDLQQYYKVWRNEDVELLTIRHYTDAIIKELTYGRTILLEQKTRATLQLIMQPT